MRFPLDDLPLASAKAWGTGAMYLIDLGRHVVPLRDLNALIDYRAARAEDEIRAMADRARALTQRQFRDIERSLGETT